MNTDHLELTASVHEEDGSYWAEVAELPGCFASGHNLDELKEALAEAIEMCLPDDVNGGAEASVKLSALTLRSSPRSHSAHDRRSLVAMLDCKI